MNILTYTSDDAPEKHRWLYGSGMPKAHNPCPAIDKHMGVESEVVGTRDPRALYDGIERQSAAINTNWRAAEDREDTRDLSKQKVLRSVSPEAQAWDGWRHGTQSQKPALEPIYLAQKPYSEKTGALNLLKHGVGAVNIDACRVPGAKTPAPVGHFRGSDIGATGLRGVRDGSSDHLGRWPANLIHDGSEAVIDLFPQSDSARKSGNPNNPKRGENHTATSYGQGDGTVTHDFRDEGSAARFFHGLPLTDEDYAWAIAAGLIDDVPTLLEPIRYQGKAKKSDRAGSKHPTVKPVALMEYCITHLTPKGGTVLDPFAGSGTTGEAARRLGFDCILMEAEPEYVDFLRQRFDLPGEIEDMLTAEIEDLLADHNSPNDETSIVCPHIVGNLDSDIMSLLS